MRAALVVLLALVAALACGACVKRERAVETRPVTADLAAYWTCAVVFASDGRGEDANEAFTFVPWFESRVRERGVFEPLERDASSEAEVVLRLDASGASGEGDRVLLRVLVLDAKTRAELGELEAEGSATPAQDAAPAGDAAETKRALALRSAADRILDHLKEKRRASIASGRASAPPPPPPLPDGPPVGPSAVCSTQCLAPAATSSSHDEQYRVSAGVDPLMRGLRDCLDRVGAQLVTPAVLLRFGPDGRLRHVRVDVGGYEDLECVQHVRTRPVRASTTRASILRCELRCDKS